MFTEVVVAPGFDDDALEVLLAKKNMRVITAEAPAEWPFDLKPLDGGFIVQQPDLVSVDRSGWEVVTEAQPTDDQWDDLVFAWQVCAAVTSNAIVYVKDRQAYGIGAGQQNRLDSARIAADRSAGRAEGGICASDAFFPFRDGLDAAAAAGIKAVIQPGGSVRDEEVIAAANEHGITMVFTHQRHFRHYRFRLDRTLAALRLTARCRRQLGFVAPCERTIQLGIRTGMGLLNRALGWCGRLAALRLTARCPKTTRVRRALRAHDPARNQDGNGTAEQSARVVRPARGVAPHRSLSEDNSGSSRLASARSSSESGREWVCSIRALGWCGRLAALRLTARCPKTTRVRRAWRAHDPARNQAERS